MSGAAVLAYHDFVEAPDAPAPSSAAYVLSQAQLAAHLAVIAGPGLRVRRLADVVDEPRAGDVVLTFDDGHVSNFTVAFPALQRRGWTGCFFIVASRVGTEHAVGWRELRVMADAGMEIGSHSLTHPFLHRASPVEIRREFGESKRMLEDGLGRPVTLASLPRGSANPEIAAIVRDLGYTSFCTSEPGLVTVESDRYLLPRIAIKQSTSIAFLERVLAGRRATLMGLQVTHAVKNAVKGVVGAERWRRVRGAVFTAAERARS